MEGLEVLKQIEINNQDVFTIRYEQDDQFLGVGFNDGSIQILTNDKVLHQIQPNEQPITSIRWRPNQQQKAKAILVSSDADGNITHWHAPSGKKLHTMKDKDNSILCMDYNYDGSRLATGGRDFFVRVWDDDIKALSYEFSAASFGNRGHSNRVFSVKFLPDNPNLLMSGGWDANILIWDLREKTCVAQFYGPSISGDALDYSNGVILSGSYRTEDQIQLWDFKTRKLIKSISNQNETMYVYAVQFNKHNDNYVFCGSSGVHELRQYNLSDNSFVSLKTQKSVLTLDQSNTEKLIEYYKNQMRSKKFVFGAINLQKKTQSLPLNEAVLASHDMCRKQKDIGSNNIAYITNLYQNFINTKPDKNQFLDILKLQFFRDQTIDKSYYTPYSLLLSNFLQQYELNQKDVKILFYATEFLFTNIKQKEAEDLREPYQLILNQVRDQNIESLFKQSFLMMKQNREYNMRLLDHVNLQLYTKSMKLDLLYLRTLVRAGRQVFPEILYELRDTILESDLIKYSTLQLLDIFEVLCSSSLNLMNTAQFKIMSHILIKENLSKLSARQQLAFLYLITKYHLYTDDLFYLFTRIIKQFDNSTSFSIYILCLSNINCKDQNFLVQLNKKFKLKEIISKMQNISKQDKDYLEYLKNKF